MQSVIDFFKTHPKLWGVTLTILSLLMAWGLAWLLPRLERRFVKRLVSRTQGDTDDRIAELLTQNLGRLTWLAGIYAASRALRAVISGAVLNILDHLVFVVLVLLLARLVSAVLRILLDWYFVRWGQKTGRLAREEFGPLFYRVMAIVVYTVAVVEILHHFKQDVSSVIVSLGVGSLAVALAAKDTLANMIAGFMIMTDRPFRLGDRILLESGEKGDVYDIGLRSTRILTFENTLIVVPNHQIINEKVTNLSYPDPQIRVTLDVGVAYGSDVEQVKAIMVALCKAHPEVLDDPEPVAYFTNFGDSSLDFRAVCRVAKWGDQWRVSEELRVALYKRLNQENIEIPFPQRDVHIHQVDKP